MALQHAMEMFKRGEINREQVTPEAERLLRWLMGKDEPEMPE